MSQRFASTFPMDVSIVCYDLEAPLDFHPVVSYAFPNPSHWVTLVLILQPYVSVRTFSNLSPITAAAVVGIHPISRPAVFCILYEVLHMIHETVPDCLILSFLLLLIEYNTCNRAENVSGID